MIEKKREKTDMENNNNNNSGNNFFSGFLLGALVGAAVVFLLATKKGKRILKIISEKGLDNISNLLEKADQAGELEEFDKDDEPSSVSAPAKAPEAKARSFTPRRFAVKETAEEKPKVRRFFRGISRHVN